MLEALSDSIRRHVGTARFNAWFAEGVTLSSQDGQVRLAAASTFERDLIRRQFDQEVQQAVAEVCGPGSSVSYQVRQDDSQTASDRSNNASAVTSPAKTAGMPPPQAAATSRSHAPAAHALEARPWEGWVSYPGNLEATRLCERFATSNGGASPVLLWGASGVGKSRLLQCVAERARRRSRRPRVLHLTAEQFLIAFVEAVRGSGLPSFRQKHRGAGVLLLDNVQQLLGKQRTAEEFLQTLDALQSEGAQVVLTADRGPDGLRDLGPEFASRLAGGVSVEVRAPDAGARRRLIEHEATRRKMPLSETAAWGLARRLMGGAREVQGALNRMGLLAETFALPIDADLAERVADDINRLSSPPVRLGDIQRAVCDVFGVEASTLRSNKRTKAVTEPRMLAMWLSRKLTGSAWSEIGDYFGRRSHSTVISAHRRVESLLAGPEPARLSTNAASDLHDAIRRVEALLRTA